MRKTIVILSMLLGGILFSSANEVPLSVKTGTHGSTMPGGNKSPVLPWYIDLTDGVITMTPTPCDYTLTLYDEDGDVAYTVFVPAGTTQIVLPSTLSGDFEIRFETDTYYYYGYISL